jgi:3D (Asp-Asp-Asp) domain-containing protein
MKRLDALLRSLSDRLFHAGGRDGEGIVVRRFTLAVVFALTACATASAPMRTAQPLLTPYERAMGFMLDSPKPQALGPDLELWATHYHTPIVRPAPKEISAAFPLIGRDGTWISPPLRHKDWCEAALQGSVSVREGSKATAYVFVDANGPEQTNCDQYLGSLSEGVKIATRRARFMAVNHPLGCGVRNIPLMPFRTVAVDARIIPVGSVVFVPELRGRSFQYDGETLLHDGYLFAGDRGGAIRGRHIDVFMLDEKVIPFEDIFASTSSRTFAAHIVADDDPAAMAVRASQSGQCEPVKGEPVSGEPVTAN